jgi:hypothetical protein
LRWDRQTVIMEVHAERLLGYVEPSFSVAVLTVVGVGGAGRPRVCRVARVLSEPQAKDGKLAVQKTHDASMSLGEIMSSTQKTPGSRPRAASSSDHRVPVRAGVRFSHYFPMASPTRRVGRR